MRGGAGEISLELPASATREGILVRARSVPELAERWREASARELFAAGSTSEGGLSACLACAHPELYTQRDFPRAWGIAIVVLAALLAPSTHYVSLFVAALVDAVLFRFAPAVVVCYVCEARHRGFAPDPSHPAFDREIEERLLYGEKAVMGKPMRPGGTAGAPEPEH